MKAVILVGGKGARLKPLTCNTPKPLLPLMNKPLIKHIISRFKAYGISEIILSGAYLSEAFFSELGGGEELGVNITYVVETEPWGSGLPFFMDVLELKLARRAVRREIL